MKDSISRKLCEINLCNDVIGAYEKIIVENKLKIKKLFSEIKPDLIDLKYSEVKQVYDLVKNMISMGDRNDLKLILMDTKAKEYSILNKASYFPVINEIGFISDDQKKYLDRYLDDCYPNKHLYTTCGRWYDLKFETEESSKIIEFLLNEKIIEKCYKMSCTCGGECDPAIFSQKKYDDFVEYHKNPQNNQEFEAGYFEVGCFSDCGYEVYDLGTFYKRVKVFSYKIIGVPDRSLDSI